MPRRHINGDLWRDERFRDLSVVARVVLMRVATGPESDGTGCSSVSVSQLVTGLRLSRDVVIDALAELIEEGALSICDDGFQVARWVVPGPSAGRARAEVNTWLG